jgi:hypothetical protein
MAAGFFTARFFAGFFAAFFGAAFFGAAFFLAASFFGAARSTGVANLSKVSSSSLIRSSLKKRGVSRQQMPEANPIQIDRARSERFFCRRKHLLSSCHQQPGCAVTAQEYSIHPARFQYPRKIFSIIRSRAGIFLREKRQGQARSVCPCIWNSLRGPRLGALSTQTFPMTRP